MLLDKARAGEPLGIDIIDIHAHYGSASFGIPDLSVDSLVDVMNRTGVTKMLCSSMACYSPNVNTGNRNLYNAIQKFPDRILGYVSAFPSSYKNVKQEIEKYLACGFAGIKLHDSNGIAYSDKAYTAAYEIAHELSLPILFHTWGKKEQLNSLQETSKRYPNAILLAAHAGAANEKDYIELAQQCKNIYLDLAYSFSPRGLVKRLVDGVGPEKIVWGSDCYFFGQAQQLGKVIGARIIDEEKILILSGNAKRILAESKL
jgi:predicted TIM-barrel fold metal-dependent hydrolase